MICEKYPCLDNLIGIDRTCAEIEPTSGLYIADVPYLTLEVLAKTTAGLSAHEVITNTMSRSYIEVVNDLAKYLTPYFRVNQVFDYLQAGRLGGATFLPFSPVRRGIKIKRTDNSTHKIVINKITILPYNTQNNVDLILKDGAFDTTITISQLVGGKQNHIYLQGNDGYVMKYDELLITLDNTALSVDEGGFYNKNTWASCGCHGGDAFVNETNLYNSDYGRFNGILRATGWDGTGETLSQSFGMSASITVGCDMDRLPCLLKDPMKMLYYYKTLINLCDVVIHSHRINDIAQSGLRDQVAMASAQLIEKYDQAYKTFADSSRMFMSGLDSPCVTCKSTTYNYSL